MANLASPYSTYSDSTPQKRIVEDYIAMLDPSDAPLIDLIGGLDGGSSKFQFTGKGKVVLICSCLMSAAVILPHIALR